MKKPFTGLTAALLAFGAVLNVMAEDKPYCTPDKSTTPTKALPTLDNIGSFTVEYRAIMGDKKYTMWAKETYDYNNNRARLDSLRAGMEETLLIDYSDETYIIYSFDSVRIMEDCEIKKLEAVTSDNLDFFAYKIQKTAGSKSIPHVLSAPHVLQMSREFGETYKGKTTIDGLDVDHWQSCLTWEDANATFTVDYYFTTEDFKPSNADTPAQIPVRAEVKGKKGTKDIHHVYEYLDFTVYQSIPKEAFSLPDFLKCSGVESSWNRPAPDVPESMSYTLEKVTYSTKEKTSKTGVMVSVSTVFLDLKHRLVRVDEGLITSIVDFNIGVEYFINEKGCVPRAIDPRDVPFAVEKSGVIQMKDREEISHLRQKFTFTGTKRYRGVLVNSFAGEQDNKNIEAFFSYADDTPVGLKVNEFTINIPTFYNIFNFVRSSKRRNENPFDLQKCRHETDITSDYMITISGTLYYLDDSEIHQVTELTRYKIAELANISPLQIVSGEITLDKSKSLIYWFVSFLEKQVTKVRATVENPATVKTSSDFIKVILTAIDEGQLSVEVPRYYYANETYVVLNFRDNYVWSEASLQSDTTYNYMTLPHMCVSHFKVMEEFVLRDTVHECAQYCSDSKTFPCTMFQFTKSTRACQVAWDEERPSLVPTPGCNFHHMSYMNNFNMRYSTVLMKKNDKAYRKADSIEACSKQCMEERKFTCESFDFCQGEKRCQIYDTHLYSGKTSPLTGDEFAGCMHLYRHTHDNFVYSFDTFQSPDAIEMSVKDESHCEYLCFSMEQGCAAYSVCNVTQCKLLPYGKAKGVNFKVKDDACYSGVARNPGSSRYVSVLDQAPSGGSTYTGAALFGLAMAMLAVGIALAALTVFLLRRFNVWQGF